ncbi:MBL fold metallo-hydrolase [Streptomyces sp. NBC_01474]|uniref:MBL fold metallo-hydrolase n=1 Tax=unclassified Streptomyces TaxID=2593676 RepID=UPI002DDA1FE5|nr:MULTISPECIES: MBL fold metallo-hydrolase [unclassified Streptomyces]WSD97112.1 MBL fold metallo-hydrolase [Streptomyces sp. NBC_01474]
MNDRRLRRPSAVCSVQVGDLKVSYVPDGAMLFKPPEPPRAGLGAAYLNDTAHLVANTGGLLVQSDGRALLIDAGFGPHSVPEDPDHPYVGAVHGGSLLDNLARLGARPDEIEVVAFTHLHRDHIGWACTDPPVFTAAAFAVPKSEWENRHQVPGLTAEALAALERRLRLVVPGEEIFPGVQTLALPGHTAGHTGFTITSRGRRLLAFGDALHSPLQVRHPEWFTVPEGDPAQSERHRRRLISELQQPGTLGFGIHFADVVFGQVVPDGAGEGADWLPV